MSTFFYVDLQLAISSVMLFMGCSFIFDGIPHRLRRSLYDVSRKFIGAAYIVYAVAMYVYCFADFVDKPPYYSVALDLTAFYTILVMLRHSFVPLLGSHVDYTNPAFVRDILYCFLFPIPAWAAISYGNENYILYVLILTNIVFAVAMICQVNFFYRLYREAVGRVNNYYSDDVAVEISWMATAIKLVLSMGVLGCFSTFIAPSSLLLGTIFILYCFMVYIYVFKSFHNFMFTYDRYNIEPALDKVDKVVDEDGHDDTEPCQIEGQKWFNSETYQLLQKNVDEWINAEGFTQKGITIVVVASKVYTNRTYLSNYINTTYNCSFKSWVTRLRIQKAKELLGEDSNISIGEVADKVGCSSANSFNHLFKQSEDVSPAKWRILHRGQ